MKSSLRSTESYAYCLGYLHFTSNNYQTIEQDILEWSDHTSKNGLVWKLVIQRCTYVWKHERHSMRTSTFFLMYQTFVFAYHWQFASEQHFSEHKIFPGGMPSTPPWCCKKPHALNHACRKRKILGGCTGHALNVNVVEIPIETKFERGGQGACKPSFSY